MRFRLCFLFCVLSGLASADWAQDPFSKAFERATPSPFVTPHADKSSPLFLSPPDPNGTTVHLLPQPRLLVVGPDHCAIPLANTPISKDHQFLIRELPADKSPKTDPMVAPTIPVCKQ